MGLDPFHALSAQQVLKEMSDTVNYSPGTALETSPSLHLTTMTT